MVKILYPGYKYLGPGNPLNNGKPINSTDEIARVHDHEYAKASHKNDIYKADWKAIKHFSKDFIKTGRPAAFVGAAGLGVKTAFERFNNRIIYPNIPGMSKKHVKLTLQEGTQRKPFWSYKYKGKRGADGQGKKQPQLSFKKTKKNSNDMEKTAENDDNANMDVDPNAHESVAEVAADSGTMSSTAGRSSLSGMRGTVPLVRGLRQHGHEFSKTYKKQYKLRLHNECVEFKRTDTSVQGFCWVRYPYHDLPVNKLAFYLSKSEIRELLNYTSVTAGLAKVDIYNKTATLTFETNSTVSTIGNNNIGVYFCTFDDDLYSKRFGKLPPQQNLIEKVFWGRPFPTTQISDWTKDMGGNIPGAQYVVRNYSNKFEYASPYSDETQNTANLAPLEVITNHLPYFDINPFIKSRKNVSFDEGLADSWEHEFNCYLFGHNMVNDMDLYNRTQTIARNETLPTTRTIYNSEQATQRTYGGIFNNIAPLFHNNNGLPEDNHGAFPFFTPHMDEAKKWLIADRFRNNGHIPAFTFGMEPLVVEKNDKWEPVSCFLDLIIDVEITLHIVQGVDYINANNDNIVRPNFMFPQMQKGKRTYGGTGTMTAVNNYPFGQVDDIIGVAHSDRYGGYQMSAAGYVPGDTTVTPVIPPSSDATATKTDASSTKVADICPPNILAKDVSRELENFIKTTKKSFHNNRLQFIDN